MSRIGVLINPRSHWNKRRRSAMRDLLSRFPDVLHAELDGQRGVEDVLREFARREVDTLVIGGGDGTVQKLLSALFNEALFEQPPALAVLPTGMANLIASNVGLKGSPRQSLVRLITRRQSGTPIAQFKRRLLRVMLSADRPPEYGMLLGTAAFYRGVMLTMNKVHPLGVEHSVATGLALAWSLAEALLRRSGPDSIYQGDTIAIELDGRRIPEREYIVVMATTHDRLSLGAVPFWGQGSGAVRFTSIAFPPHRLARALLPTLRGRPRPWMRDSGYVSENAHALSLRMTCRFVLDGEEFAPTADDPVIVTADQEAVFLRC